MPKLVEAWINIALVQTKMCEEGKNGESLKDWKGEMKRNQQQFDSGGTCVPSNTSARSSSLTNVLDL